MEDDLIRAVKEHAVQYYLEGWADVADSYGRKEICAIIHGAETRHDAIVKMQIHVNQFPSNFNPNALIG